VAWQHAVPIETTIPDLGVPCSHRLPLGAHVPAAAVASPRPCFGAADILPRIVERRLWTDIRVDFTEFGDVCRVRVSQTLSSDKRSHPL
jgi:hypothetical protein